MLAENGRYVRSRIRAIEVVAEIVDDALNQVLLVVGGGGSIFGCEARSGGPAGGRVVEAIEDVIQFERGAWRWVVAVAFHFVLADRDVAMGLKKRMAKSSLWCFAGCC